MSHYLYISGNTSICVQAVLNNFSVDGLIAIISYVFGILLLGSYMDLEIIHYLLLIDEFACCQ